ncbi:MAG: MBL fold metallo-hydrolase [Pseudomonadota bacterium]
MTLHFTILGCGSSGGVPRVGQGWGTCDPNNPKNRRRRCSLLVEKTSSDNITRVLVDTSPDLRDQLLEADVTALDGVLFTHEHADHTHGIDDLRGLVLNMRRRIDVHADAQTADMLRTRFGYCFTAPSGSDYPPILNLHEARPLRPITISGEGGDIDALPVPVPHGSITATGYRFGGLMYTPDLNGITAAYESHFHGLDVWIIDALRDKQHPSHFSLNDALAAIDRFKPKRAILTNMHNDMDYAVVAAQLPQNAEPAWDGFKISL